MITVDPESRGFDAGRLARIGNWMQRYVDAQKFAGSSLVIARGGDIVYRARAGMRDIAGGQPFSDDTIARIYSMTKPITSVALMILVERGLVHLAAPLSEFIPEFTDCDALIPHASRIDQVEPAPSPTLHQALTHTSGLSYPFNPGVLPALMDETDILFKSNQGLLADMAAKVAKLPLAFQPGTRWEYSVGIDIIGRVIEVISGKSLADFIAEEITGPLGMTETAFSVPPAARGRFAALYTPLAGDAMALNSAARGADPLRLIDTPDTSPFLNASMFSGGGGMVGTIDDYLRFCEMLRQGGALDGVRLLSPKTVAFMFSNHLEADIASLGVTSFGEQPMEGVGFGIGGSVTLAPGRAGVPGSLGDFSWGGMASTFFWIDPVLDLSVVFFTQLSPSSSYPARPELKALVHGALVK